MVRLDVLVKAALPCKKHTLVLRLLSSRGISLARANIIIDNSTRSKTLNKNGFHGRAPQRKPLLSKNITTGQIFCGQMKQKIEFLGRNTQRYEWREKRVQILSLTT